MKYRIVSILAYLLLVLPGIQGQDSLAIFYPIKEYKGWVYLKEDLRSYEGMIKGSTPTELILQTQHSSEFQRFSYPDLHLVQIRPKGKVARGTLIGAAVGFGTGFIVGMVLANQTKVKDDPLRISKQLSPLAGLITGGAGAVVGLTVGVAVGSWRQQYHIEGEQDKFLQLQQDLSPQLRN